MPAKTPGKIGADDIKKLEPGQIVWDQGKGAVSGFAARRQKGDAVTYVFKYRTAEGRQRWQTIGRHGSPWTTDEARKEAKRLIGEVVDGGDPQGEKAATRKAATVSELCDLYWEDAEAGRLLTRRREAKKASTLVTDKGRVERHIKPLLGKLKVAAVSRDDVKQFMSDVAEGKTAAKAKTAKKRGLANVRGGRGTASRTMGLLGAIFTYAIDKRMRTDNPVHGVTRYADGKRERRLTEAEYKALGDALRKAAEDDIWTPALGAAKFLALTGWRSGEALALKWDAVDLTRRTATLADTKTGRSMRPLSKAACDLLKKTDRLGELVFPASRGKGKMAGFPKLWARIAKLGDLPADITPHVLRHSFASEAADLEYSELTIAALLGHRKASVTSKYAHHADAVLLAAADAVSDRVTEFMGDAQPTGSVIPFKVSHA